VVVPTGAALAALPSHPSIAAESIRCKAGQRILIIGSWAGLFMLVEIPSFKVYEMV